MSLFLTFEGPEGAGKSTQVARLQARLEGLGIPHLFTREPGGTVLGAGVRELVLHADVDITPVAEFLLYSASRAQLVRDVLRPALARGEVVVCDRYADSSAAYQGMGRGLDSRFITDVTWEATGGLRPQLTFLLDLDPALGLARAARTGTPDRLERADLEFHRRVRAGFLAIAGAEPERVLVLDATLSPEVIEEQIWSVVAGALGLTNR